MITMIVGSMYSGKSTELFRRANCLSLGNIPYVVLRPKTDTRKFLVRGVKDDFKHLNIQTVEKVEDLERPLQYKHVLIDEFQFFKNGADFCNWLAANDVEVTVACLNADSNAEGWAEVDKLFHHAENIVKLNAVCSCCGDQNATYSHFKKGDRGADQVLIGDDIFQPLCRKCYRSLMGIA